jgi:hypothetical protein
MWTDWWRKEPNYKPGCGGPERWWGSDHSSGYSVGETDAGRYMACDNRGNGLRDDEGEYLVFPTTEAAKEYVETYLARSAIERSEIGEAT